MRLVQRSTFDVTPERIADDAQNDLPPSAIALGAVLDREGRDTGDFQVPLSTLNRHAFICGATGSGKSQTARHLLGQLIRTGMPWLVIEPVKAEYRRMAARAPLFERCRLVPRPENRGDQERLMTESAAYNEVHLIRTFLAGSDDTGLRPVFVIDGRDYQDAEAVRADYAEARRAVGQHRVVGEFETRPVRPDEPRSPLPTWRAFRDRLATGEVELR